MDTRPREATWSDLVGGALQGETRALARLITRIENREPGWRDAMKSVCPHVSGSPVIGFTGAPGAGKSSLATHVATALVERGHRLGIIAVDPTSPFSGGSLLGDRLRMRDVATRSGVFIRSMATRGMLGGLSPSSRDVARVLDAAGFDRVLIETVGVGQDEIEVVRAADWVVLICAPGQGDGVQALKAGVMEIADLFVVNKADRDGADELVADIEALLALARNGSREPPPVLRTCALDGRGTDALVRALLERLARPDPSDRRVELRVRGEILARVEGDLLWRLRLAAPRGKARRRADRPRGTPRVRGQQRSLLRGRVDRRRARGAGLRRERILDG
ncbi:MAG: methylmalonyl Co-A mutase-associated GTPase MeaB [Myxococcota bacterium]